MAPMLRASTIAEPTMYYVQSACCAANGNESARVEKLLTSWGRLKRSMHILNTFQEDANSVNPTWTCSGGLLDYCLNVMFIRFIAVNGNH